MQTLKGEKQKTVERNIAEQCKTDEEFFGEMSKYIIKVKHGIGELGLGDSNNAETDKKIKHIKFIFLSCFLK